MCLCLYDYQSKASRHRKGLTYLKNKATTNQKHTIVSQKSKRRRYTHNIIENHHATKKKNKDDSKSGTLSLADRIWSCDPSKRGHDPTEVSAQVRKSNVTFLPGFSNVLRLVTAFSFSFLHFSEKMSVLDGRSIIVFGSKEHVF